MSELEDLIQQACAIARHQQNGRVHPLTCGIDSRHAPLVPSYEDGRIVLRCLGSMSGLTAVPCAYRQELAPRLASVIDSGTKATDAKPAASTLRSEAP